MKHPRAHIVRKDEISQAGPGTRYFVEFNRTGGAAMPTIVDVGDSMLAEHIVDFYNQGARTYEEWAAKEEAERVAAIETAGPGVVISIHAGDLVHALGCPHCLANTGEFCTSDEKFSLGSEYVHKARLDQTPGAVFDLEDQAFENVLSVACPHCISLAGMRCIEDVGFPVRTLGSSSMHQARVDAFNSRGIDEAKAEEEPAEAAVLPEGPGVAVRLDDAAYKQTLSFQCPHCQARATSFCLTTEGFPYSPLGEKTVHRARLDEMPF